MSYRDTIDFEKYVGNAVNKTKENDEMPMSLINIPGEAGKRRGGCYGIFRDSNGSLVAKFLTPTMDKSAPIVQNGRAIAELQALVSGLA